MCHPQGELEKAGAPAELQWSEFLHLLPSSASALLALLRHWLQLSTQ